MPTDDELNKVAADAFRLALRIFMQAHDVDPPGTEAHKPWDLLTEIAEGRAELASTLKPENVPEHMKEFIERVRPMVVEHDKQLARRVLDGHSK